MKKIVGILGYPIEHSLSPKMHNAVFEKLNMDYIYLAFEIKENYLKSAVSGIKALNIKGVNVTLPYKERIVEYVDELSKEAQVLSAINTIVNKNNKLKGYNTDVVGFCKSLQRFNIDLTNKTVLLIGAGGAAKALTYALTTYYKLKKLIIANRTYSRAEELIKKFSFDYPVEIISLSKIPKYLTFCDMLINATSCGLKDKEYLFDYSSIKPYDIIIYDLIYNPKETELIKYAKKFKKFAINGIYMLIYQGAESFKLWTGIYPPVNIMEEVLRNYML